MGLFSSKKVTTVGTSVSRVIGESDLPNSLKTGVINSLFQEGDLTDFILEELIGSIALKANRAYKYAESTYSYGLPSGQVFSSSKGREEVTAILSSIEGSPVSVNYSNFGPINSLHVAWMELIRLYGYVSESNEVTTKSIQKTHPVYLKNMQIAMPSVIYNELDINAIEQWGPAPTTGFTPDRAGVSGILQNSVNHPPVIVDDTLQKEHARVTVCWAVTTVSSTAATDFTEITTTEVFYETFDIPLPDRNPDADFYHVKYLVNTTTKYWLYESGTGGYPILDNLFEVDEELLGSYFPFLYFRFGKQSMLKKKGTPEYDTSKKLAKYFGMDYESVIEAVHDNPDIEDVEQAMMVMAVDPKSQDKEDLRYLFDYFRAQANVQNPPQYSFPVIDFITKDTNVPVVNTTVIADKRFKMALSNAGISKKLAYGKLGKVNSYHSIIKTTYLPGEYFDNVELRTVQTSYKITTHHFRKQLSEHVYEEVSVRNLKMTYHIYGKYTTTGDEKEDILLVPIDRAISNKYPLSVRENLYSSSMHYVFNSRIVTKIKWYQSTFFTFLITVAAIAIGGYFLAPKLAPLMAGLAAGTITLQALAMTMAMKLVESLVMQEIIKVFVKAIGLENAFLVAILSVVALAGFAAMNGGFSKMPWGDTLLKATTGLISGTNKAFAGAMQELQVEFEKFGLYVQEQNELLKEQMDLLKGNNLLSPFIVFGESPNDFYNRTVHSGNIGVIGIYAVKHYVPNALTLPKLTDTLGEDEYGLA